ncbi:MAG: hypothetical protein ACPG4K_13710 [Haloferula sp.]
MLIWRRSGRIRGETNKAWMNDGTSICNDWDEAMMAEMTYTVEMAVANPTPASTMSNL